MRKSEGLGVQFRHNPTKRVRAASAIMGAAEFCISAWFCGTDDSEHSMYFFGAGILAGLLVGLAIEWAVDWSAILAPTGPSSGGEVGKQESDAAPQ